MGMRAAHLAKRKSIAVLIPPMRPIARRVSAMGMAALGTAATAPGIRIAAILFRLTLSTDIMRRVIATIAINIPRRRDIGIAATASVDIGTNVVAIARPLGTRAGILRIVNSRDGAICVRGAEAMTMFAAVAIDAAPMA